MEPKTTGDKFLDNGAAFGVILATAEHVVAHPSRDGAVQLATRVLDFARLIGLGHLLEDHPAMGGGK